jgi:hypothetical protein
MIQAVTRDQSGRRVIILGLSEENWRRLASSMIQADVSQLGVDVTVVLYRGSDQRDLKAKLVEMGVADRSLLDVEDATPDESRLWRRTDNGPVGE